MLFAGAAAAALLSSPGLRWCVSLATARRPNPRLLASAAVATALLIAWRATGPLHGLALATVAATGIVAAWIDAYDRRLPDVLVLPAYPAVAALLLATGDGPTIVRSAVCGIAAAAVYAIGFWLGQVGFGDVKLAGLLGLVLGWASWQTAAVALVATAAVGGGQALLVMCGNGKDLPFGPAMLLGAAIAVAAAPGLVP